MKALVSLVCVVSLFFHASGQAKFSVKCVNISASTVQSWSPGNNQIGDKATGGTIYQIDAVLKKSGHHKFDSLLIDGINLPMEVVKDTERSYAGPFKKGDSITLLARRNKGVIYPKSSSEIIQLVSTKKEVVAFISIWVNGKRYLHPVTEFKKTSRQNANQ